MNRRKLVWVVSALLLWSGSGCGAGDEGPGGGACLPGLVSPCPCPDGSSGRSTCDAAGNPGLCACGAAALPQPITSPGAPTATGQPASATDPAADTGVATTDPAATDSAMTEAGSAGAPAPAEDPAIEEPVAVGDGVEVPATDHCAAVADWDPAWAEFEEEVLRLTNEARAAGATCGELGPFEPAGPLVMSPELRCAARLHSQDMGQQGYFDHDSPDGRTPFDRMSAAGYSGGGGGENIAMGQPTPADVVAGWMDSPGHCSNIMQPGFTEIGIGYWAGAADNPWFNSNVLWTQNFGAPGFGGGACPLPPPWC
ncbi:MAG: CAP domain-containing protein [Myxococcales bacterium]|nr:CAP domain-containing protein [Myxococcales bacterium]